MCHKSLFITVLCHFLPLGKCREGIHDLNIALVRVYQKKCILKLALGDPYDFYFVQKTACGLGICFRIYLNLKRKRTIAISFSHNEFRSNVGKMTRSYVRICIIWKLFRMNQELSKLRRMMVLYLILV